MYTKYLTFRLISEPEIQGNVTHFYDEYQMGEYYLNEEVAYYPGF